MASKWKNAEYADAANRLTGRMICSVCNKPIVEGEYRFRDAGDRYITQHRACSAEDPNWDRIDRKRAEARVLHEQFEREAREFVAKWGVVDLEEFEALT